MILYPLYLKEREGLETLETEIGFATYKFRVGKPWVGALRDHFYQLTQ